MAPTGNIMAAAAAATRDIKADGAVVAGTKAAAMPVEVAAITAAGAVAAVGAATTAAAGGAGIGRSGAAAAAGGKAADGKAADGKAAGGKAADGKVVAGNGLKVTAMSRGATIITVAPIGSSRIGSMPSRRSMTAAIIIRIRKV